MTQKQLEKEIIKDRKILGGIPVFKGTRIPVAQILALLARGKRKSYIIHSFTISSKQIDMALQYAALELNGQKA